MSHLPSISLEIGRAEVGVVESSVGEDVFRSVDGLCIELELIRGIEEVEDVSCDVEEVIPGIPSISPVVGLAGYLYAALLLRGAAAESFLLTLGVADASLGAPRFERPPLSLLCMACIV